MTPDEFVPVVTDVGPGEDLRFTPPPGGTGDPSAISASQTRIDDAVLHAIVNSQIPTPDTPTDRSEPSPPARVRVKKTDSPGANAFNDLLDFLSRLPEHLPEKTRTFRVLGHNVAWNHRRDIARMAGMVMLEHMSAWEFARVVQTGGYGLEAYMQTLREIRDDKDNDAKDRITAADKLLQLFGVFMSGMSQEVAPKPTQENAGNLMQILLNVRGEGEANAESRLPEETGVRALGDSNASH